MRHTPQGELGSPQSILAAPLSPLPSFSSAVKEAHNIISQVDLQHRRGAGPVPPLSRVYAHWSVHTKVDPKKTEDEKLVWGSIWVLIRADIKKGGFFDVRGILKESGVYPQPQQQLKRSREAYFYLFDHVRSVMFP